MKMTTILGISFNTRMLGLAVFQSHTIIDYSLKFLKEMWSPQKLDSILSSLASCISSYGVKDIALSIPDKHAQTKEFEELQHAIECLALRHGITINKYTAKELYERFGNPIRRTRKAFMKRLVLFYPELSIYYEREQTNKNKYYIKLFEAIAVAGYHSQQKKLLSYERQG